MELLQRPQLELGATSQGIDKVGAGSMTCKTLLRPVKIPWNPEPKIPNARRRPKKHRCSVLCSPLVGRGLRATALVWSPNTWECLPSSIFATQPFGIIHTLTTLSQPSNYHFLFGFGCFLRWTKCRQGKIADFWFEWGWNQEMTIGSLGLIGWIR